MSQARNHVVGRGLAALIPTGPATAPGLGSAAADVVIGVDKRNPSPPPPTKAAPKTPKATKATAAKAAVEAEPETELEPTGAVYLEIEPSLIETNPKQPRSVFDEEALAELVHSIREFGLMQPIVVRAMSGSEADDSPRYQLVMGERRWRAAQQAGVDTVPAIVRETADDNMLRDALLENMHRAQLNPLEEAAAYQQLLEEFDVTHDELAITNMIRLLRLPIAVQRRVAAWVLSAGHARALLALDGGPELQEELAARIVAEGLSVRATEEAVTLGNRDQGGAPAGPRRKPIQMPGLQDVAEQLSTALDTRVSVSLGKRKGKIVVEFGSVDDLQRIVELMNTPSP